MWAEDSERPVTSTRQALRSARPHPFAASVEELTQIGAGKADEADLLLPSLRKSPLDSPELLRVTPRPKPQKSPMLLPWTVPIIAFDADGSLAFLSDDDEQASDEATCHYRLGASLLYWHQVRDFAEQLVTRGRVIPAIDHDDDGLSARWRPVVEGQDIVALHSLIMAMPPICRAVVGYDNANELVDDGVGAIVDAVARRSLPTDLVLAKRRGGRRPKRPKAVEAWLGALVGPDRCFDADPDDLQALRDEMTAWADVGSRSTGPARLTFRLRESDADAEADPETGQQNDPDEHRWRLEFLLQSMEDPSLLIPAAQAWGDLGGLARWVERPQELLLGELGRAARIYPELGVGLRTATPTGLDLDAEGTYRFLAVVAQALDEAGFGVFLPTWWDHRQKIGITATATTPTDPMVEGASRFGRDQLMDFQWRLAVGDETLSDQEIEALAATKAPLVHLRGQWVAVDPDQLRRGLEFLASRSDGEQKTADEVLALATTHPDDLDTPLPVMSVTADGWLGDFLTGTAVNSLEPVSVPDDFDATLRPYQERGLAWLKFLSSLGLGACLADDMGLGKTVQLLALEAVERSDDPEQGPTLLLCPLSLVGNWQREAERFAGQLRVHAHHGRDRAQGDDFQRQVANADLVVTTYATATRDIELLADHNWRRVVLDEAQAIKNSRSQMAKAATRLRADHRVALTGTPVENRLSELWSIMNFLNPGMLGSSDRFHTRFAIPIERHQRHDMVKRLRDTTRPYILRRLKTDPTIIDDLPEKIEITQYYRLTAEQASLYKAIVDEMMERIENTEGIKRRGNVLATMTKLKQVCNHPAHLLHDRSAIGHRSGKVTRLEEILDEVLAGGDKVLCFTQFTEFAEMMLPHLAARFGTDVAYLHGGTSKNRREETVAQFQSDDGPPIFLLSLKAGGTGLNLTAANQVIHLDRWWNPAVENQATDRAFRIGQTRNVQVHKFVCSGTLEERIDDMIEEKKALAELAVTDGEHWLTGLSTTDLRDLFALSEEPDDE